MAKLTYQQKVEIFKRRLNGESSRTLASIFNVSYQYIDYLTRLLNKHGINILKPERIYSIYSNEFIQRAIDRVLLKNQAITSVAIDIGLTSKSILLKWIKKYKENCSNVIENKKGRKPKTMTKIKKTIKLSTNDEKIKDLEKEILKQTNQMKNGLLM